MISHVLRSWGYLWLIEVAAFELSVVRFEKAVGYDSLNVNVTEVGNKFAEVLVPGGSEGRREQEG